MRAALHYAKSLFGNSKIVGCEIGVNNGDNARIIMDEWAYGLQILHLVELNADKESTIRNKLGNPSWPDHQHILHIGDSSEIAATFSDASLDFVYIDDNHTESGVTKSIDAWWPKVKIGGVFGGHDYIWNHWDLAGCAVKKVVDKWSIDHNQWLQLGEYDWWCVKR